MRNRAILSTMFLLACTEAPRPLDGPPPADADLGQPGATDLSGYDAGVYQPMSPGITAVSPAIISSAGGAEITVTGGPFLTSTQFFLNNLAVNVKSVSTGTAVLLAPPRAGLGPATLVARNLDGRTGQNSNDAGSMSSLRIYAAQPSFSQISYPTGAARPRGASFGDLNQDGRADVIVTHQDSASYTVLLGSGTGAFTPLLPTSVFTTISSQTGANNAGLLVDLNGDNFLDLLYGTNSTNFHYYLGNGAGLVNMAQAAVATGSATVANVATADINGDTKPDVITANTSTNLLGLFLNTGAGASLSFGTQTTYALPTGVTVPNRVMVRDLNNDGYPEAIVLSETANAGTLSVFKGANMVPYFTLASPATYGTNAASPSALPRWFDLGDVNGDGKLDAVVTNSGSNSMLVFLGNGTSDNAFAAPLNPIQLGAAPRQVVLADFNGDGRLDAAVTNNGSNTVSVLFGDNMGSFGGRLDMPSINAPWAIHAMDLNGDGRADLAVTNEVNAANTTNPGYLTIYLNTSQ